MTFYWGYDATILFPWWQCSTALEFYTSCFCVFIVCLSSSKLKAICHEIQQARPRSTQGMLDAGCSEPSLATSAGGADGRGSSSSPVPAEGDRWSGTPPLLKACCRQPLHNTDPVVWTQVPDQPQYGGAQGNQRLGKARVLTVWFLLFISVMIDWAMMLVCMTFNGGLFLAVVSGVATGQLFLQHTSDRGAGCCSAGIHG